MNKHAATFNAPYAIIITAIFFSTTANALNCTIETSQKLAWEGELIQFWGTFNSSNASLPVEKLEITRDNAKTWAGTVITNSNSSMTGDWHDNWIANTPGLHAIQARATDANKTQTCSPGFIDIIVREKQFKESIPYDPTPTPKPLPTATATPAPSVSPTPLAIAKNKTVKTTPTPMPKFSREIIDMLNASKNEPLPTPYPVEKKNSQNTLDSAFKTIGNAFASIWHAIENVFTGENKGEP